MRLVPLEKAVQRLAGWKKPKVIAAIALLAAVICAAYFLGVRPRQSSAEYLTDTVKRGNVTSAVSASGTVEPVTSVTLGFKNAEVISGIYVKVGDRVKKDSKSGQELMSLLQKLNEELGITVIVVTHEKEISLYCRRIVEIKDGRIVGTREITPKKLQNSHLGGEVTSN